MAYRAGRHFLQIPGPSPVPDRISRAIDAAAIILVVPIVIPLIQAAGIDPNHFGLVVTLNLALGQQTPPVASVLITSCAVARANIWDVSKINIYFIAVLFAVLMLCTYVPSIPMYLVDVIYRS